MVKKYVCIPRSFLVINICNWGKILFSPCIFCPHFMLTCTFCPHFMLTLYILPTLYAHPVHSAHTLCSPCTFCPHFMLTLYILPTFMFTLYIYFLAVSAYRRRKYVILLLATWRHVADSHNIHAIAHGLLYWFCLRSYTRNPSVDFIYRSAVIWFCYYKLNAGFSTFSSASRRTSQGTQQKW
jgi:hypothetical protein